MNRAPHDLTSHSPEHSVAELLRVTLLLMKPYTPSIGSHVQLRELESVMRCTIETLESTNPRERGHSCRTVLQFRAPRNKNCQ